MADLNTNLQRLQDNSNTIALARTAIANAIINKGGTVNSNDGLNNFADDINTIKNELTSININENGTYSNSIEDTISTNNYPIIINANGDNIKSITINGNSNQASTPTPTNPVQPSGCGERTGNLVDKIFASGYNISSNGNPTAYQDDSRCATLEPIDVSNVNNVTFSFVNTASDTKNFIYSLFNGSTLVARTAGGQSGDTIDVSLGDKLYLCVYSNLTSVNASETTTNIMLNEGSTPLPYEPYGYKIPISSNSTTTSVYLGEVQTTRRIYKLVLTGDEASWGYNAQSEFFYLSTVTPDYLKLKDTITSFCSHYKSVAQTIDAAALNNGEQSFWYAETVQRLYIKDTNYTSITSLKQYLADQYAVGTPVTVWYVLATPETAVVNEPLMKIGEYSDILTLTNTTIKTISGNNTIDYNLITKPSNTSITYNKININKTITSDTLPITFNSTGDNVDIILSGQSSQSSTPTLSSPVDVSGVGERTANLLFSSQNQTIGSTLHRTQTIGNSNFILNKDVSQSDTSANIDIDVTLPAGTYTVSVIGLNLYNNDYDRLFIRDDNSTIVVQNVQVNRPRSFTLTETTHIYRLTVVAASQSTYNNTNIQIMLNSGGTALPYQPYGIKIPISSGGVTTPVYLGETQSTRRIKKLVLDGTEDWKLSSTTNQFYMDTVLEAIPFIPPTCTHFKGVSSLSGDNQIVISASQKINIRTTYIQHNLTDWIAYLQQQYANGTPVTVWYVLTEPTTGIINEPLMKISNYADTLSTTIPTLRVIYKIPCLDIYCSKF